MYTHARTDTHTDMHTDSHGHTHTHTETHTHTDMHTDSHARTHTLLWPEAGGHYWALPGPLALRCGSHTLPHPGGESANSSYLARKVIVSITRAGAVKTPASCRAPHPEALGTRGRVRVPGPPLPPCRAFCSPIAIWKFSVTSNKAPHVSPQGVTGSWGLPIKQPELGVSPRGLRPADTKGGFTRTRLVLGFSGSHEARQEGCGMPVSNMGGGAPHPRGGFTASIPVPWAQGAKEQRGRGWGGWRSRDPGLPLPSPHTSSYTSLGLSCPHLCSGH